MLNVVYYVKLGFGKLRVMWGGGAYELPTSHGWPCSIENKLLLKQRETHINHHHHRHCHLNHHHHHHHHNS